MKLNMIGMRRKRMALRFVVLGILCIFLLSGCFIQSIQPFYTQDLKIEFPRVKGAWLLKKIGDEDVSAKYPEPWIFTERAIKTFEYAVESELTTQFFKIGDTLFVDLKAGDPYQLKNPNHWWNLHVIPVHSVCKVLIRDNQLFMTPLDGDWVTARIKKKELNLGYVNIGDKEDQYVLTSSPKDLALFLKDVAGNEDAFPPGAVHMFVRSAEAGGK
jgi:hypothetical protein